MHAPLKNQKGQALFELIIFIPFLVFLYTIYATAGNSISASINQQKSVRGYYYSLMRGNSYINTLSDLEEYSRNNVGMVGFSAVGWREKGEKAGRNAFGPCFKFSSLLKGSSSREDCDSPDRETDNRGNGISHFIRVFTFYGVCGPVYSEVSDPNSAGFYLIHPSIQTDPGKCSLAATSPIN